MFGIFQNNSKTKVITLWFAEFPNSTLAQASGEGAHSPMLSAPKPMRDGPTLPTTCVQACPRESQDLRFSEVTDQAVGP